MDVSTGNHNTQMDNTNGDPMNEVVQADANSPNPQRPTVTDGQDPSESVDAELEAMKKRLQQMEQETLGVHSTEDAPPVEGVDDGSGNGGRVPNAGGMHPHHGGHHPNAQAAAIAAGFAGVDEMTADSDARSIYVGNVDYNASGEELNQHFQECGTINRVTIMTHKATRQPKGYAYIEFKERESVQNALILNESMFRGRQLKVVEKRTNIPGVTRGGMGGRGRGRFQRGGWRGGFRGRPRGRGRGNGRGGRWAPPY